MPLEARTGDYSTLVAELVGMIKIHPNEGFIDKADLTNNWKLIGDRHHNKLTALNPSAGVFIKFFPPGTKDYAEKYQQTLQKLAKIENLPMPILLPEALTNGGLVFKAGEPLGKIKFESFDECVQDKISKIVLENGLEPLAWFDKLDVVKVDGTDFLVDPIDDSVHLIDLYVENESLLPLP